MTENIKHIAINCIEETGNGIIGLPIAHEGAHWAHWSDKIFQQQWYDIFANDEAGRPSSYASRNYLLEPEPEGDVARYSKSRISKNGITLENCMDHEIVITKTLFKKIHMHLQSMPAKIREAVKLIKYDPNIPYCYFRSTTDTDIYLKTTEDVAESVEWSMLAALNPRGHKKFIDKIHNKPTLRDRIYFLQEEGFLNEWQSKRLLNNSWREHYLHS